MTTYVWRDGAVVEKEAPRPPAPGAAVMPDIAPFMTQDGKTEITSRSQLRAYEHAHGVKQVGNDWTGSEKPPFWDRMARAPRPPR